MKEVLSIVLSIQVKVSISIVLQYISWNVSSIVLQYKIRVLFNTL